MSNDPTITHDVTTRLPGRGGVHRALSVTHTGGLLRLFIYQYQNFPLLDVYGESLHTTFSIYRSLALANYRYTIKRPIPNEIPNSRSIIVPYFLLPSIHLLTCLRLSQDPEFIHSIHDPANTQNYIYPDTFYTYTMRMVQDLDNELYSYLDATLVPLLDEKIPSIITREDLLTALRDVPKQ